MAFEYTPTTQQSQDYYRPFQARQRAQQQATAPNLAQLAKATKGLSGIYNSLNAGQAAGAGASAAGTGYGLGNSLVAGEAGNASYAGASGATAGSEGLSTAGSAGTSAGGSAGGSSLGQVAGYAGMAKDAYGITQGMQTPQGVEGRDQGTVEGSALAAGSGAAQGFSAGGPIGAIVGAGLGNESYQWQHGNRESLTSIDGLIKSELTGGLAARDIGRWTGLWR